MSKSACLKIGVKSNINVNKMYSETTQSISLNRIPFNPGIHNQKTAYFILKRNISACILFDMLILIHVVYDFSIILIICKISKRLTNISKKIFYVTFIHIVFFIEYINSIQSNSRWLIGFEISNILEVA